jgi:hypothetical protein
MTTWKNVTQRLRSFLIWTVDRWDLALLLAALLLVLAAEGPPPGDLDAQIDRLLADKQFDFIGWEAEALLGKLAHSLVSPQRYMDESSRHDFFLDYLALVGEIGRTEWDIYRVYTDPDVEDPEAVAVALQARLQELRMVEENRQYLAEAILEEQVSSVLVGEEFGVLGQEFPPIGAHFTPLPALLVVSARDHIERLSSLSLEHGLNAAQREDIERQVDTSHDVSSLVTDIGGLSAYPAMLLESSSLDWVAEVTAHEWTHHYLTPRPLGWNYEDPETRTINETVASIVGKEIGRLTVAHYYPEFLPADPEPALEEADEPEEPEEEQPPPEPPAFDFRREMRETRIRVDELLAEGKIDEAEAYMEKRRQDFVAEGYYIRKLNQAYFAFHGAYADEPGAAGTDPTGPKVQELRARSSDLHSFVVWVSRVTTLAQLEDLLEEMEGVSGSSFGGRQARR